MSNAPVNQGKICISLCAKTPAELAEKIERAAPLADVIEVRFDCAAPDQLDECLGVALAAKANILATFRPQKEGGFRDINDDERAEFWNAGNELGFWGADFEEDRIEDSFYWLWGNRIVSFHDFATTPDDLADIYERLSATGADIVKIAVHANRITDTIRLWNLLEPAHAENKQPVPIAMGEAGKWTRVLGLAHGSPLAYASLEDASGTAPGQITAGDLIDVYRVKELSRESRVFGLIAGDTSYSMSPYIQNAAIKAAGIDAVFVPLQVSDTEEFFRRMVREATREIDLNFRGFAVTNPHKRAVIDVLDSIDETAEAIGAVNTIFHDTGKWLGTNTDAEGFIAPLKERFGSLQGAKVAVIGAGGAARACVYALRRDGADVTVHARDTSKAKPLADQFDAKLLSLEAFERPDILVNTTPLGTRGEHQSETPVSAEKLSGIKLVYDLTYNPRETRLLSEAREAGCETLDGLEMLIRQAAAQFKIWTGLEADTSVMRTAAIKRLER
ncbi:MAG: shikimate dehydrogenase [Acidobacteria bacterium]|nr:shikimate dehydrogenase [Acidobacteriota bacterium]